MKIRHNPKSDNMVLPEKKKLPACDGNLTQYRDFTSATTTNPLRSSSANVSSSTFPDASSQSHTHRPSLPYLLFTVVVNLNALSLLPPKLDGQIRRQEIKGKQPSGKYIKCHKNVLKKKLKRHQRHENYVVQQLQRHCAFCFLVLLVVVMMSFGDAGGIIDEPHYASPSHKNESLFGFGMNDRGTESGRSGFLSNGYQCKNMIQHSYRDYISHIFF